jgi:hypothetical protein
MLFKLTRIFAFPVLLTVNASCRRCFAGSSQRRHSSASRTLFEDVVPLNLPHSCAIANEDRKMSLHRRPLSVDTLTRLRSPSKNNMSYLLERFARDKVPPDLRQALNLLRLDNYEEFEERFLSTDAFLKPWAVFRDSIFLVAPDAMPNPTKITPMGIESSDGVSRLEILYFYTHFDEGTLRYDPRADRSSVDYTPDTSVYGVIDKSKWRLEEYEKHLYAWMLQEFKVGKSYNPWRFEFFELKNVCKVWVEVLVPIVNAVRASYNPLGRRHYGRLALFIEDKCPSQLAFPGSNVNVPQGGLSSPTPYRVVSVPRKTVNEEETYGTLTRKHYDAAEKELRDVYPQYGGLVERPKFKHKMEEWLGEQRVRAAQRKGLAQPAQIQSLQPLPAQTGGVQASMMQTPRGSPRRQEPGSTSPIKKCADNIKRSLSKKLSSLRLREEHKSPLHGVTRPLHFPERASTPASSHDSDSMVGITPLPRPHPMYRLSESSTFASVRNSNPFNFDLPDRARTDAADPVFSPMGQLSAIPRSLHEEHQTAAMSSSSFVSNGDSMDTFKLLNDGLSSDEPGPLHGFVSNQDDHLVSGKMKATYDVRAPSYEGTQYQKEISLTDLHTQRLQSARSPPIRTRTPATRLPAPIIPVPYSGPRIASADTPGKSPSKPSLVSSKPVVAPPKPVAWPGSLPKATAWPGFNSDDSDDSLSKPPIPVKSPERQIRNPRSRQPVRGDAEDSEVYRIVSRENIRAALGDVSRESSAEDLVPQKPFADSARTMSPMKQPLNTFNTHLFPRKSTPVGGWVNAKGDKDGGYEMSAMNHGKRKDFPE